MLWLGPTRVAGVVCSASWLQERLRHATVPSRSCAGFRLAGDGRGGYDVRRRDRLVVRRGQLPDEGELWHAIVVETCEHEHLALHLLPIAMIETQLPAYPGSLLLGSVARLGR